MKLLFSSILSAASRSLLLTVTPLGLRISAVIVNFSNPVGDNVALNTLSDPTVLGVSLTYIFSSDLEPIR